METAIAKRRRSAEIVAVLAAWYPDATRSPLRWSTPLELLVATILAAQSRDDTVNLVMPGLLARFPDAAALASAPIDELEALVRQTGFFRNKARLVQGCCRQLVERHGGEVPPRMADLTALPGVGRKTANVVLTNCFGIPGIVVDTHVLRVSGRLGLTASSDPEVVEADVGALLPESEWAAFCHRVTWFGREVCLARKPRCAACRLRPLCPWVHVGGFE